MFNVKTSKYKIFSMNLYKVDGMENATSFAFELDKPYTVQRWAHGPAELKSNLAEAASLEDLANIGIVIGMET